MQTTRFNRHMLLRLIALFIVTGLVAALLPLPQFDSQVRAIDAMSPLKKSLSGLYGEQ